MKLMLCNGRHEPPYQGIEAIFPNTIADPTDTKSLYVHIMRFMHNHVNPDCIDLYVTGLTVAVGAVMQYCYRNDVPLTLWHYNSVTGTWYNQVIISGTEAYCRSVEL